MREQAFSMLSSVLDEAAEYLDSFAASMSPKMFVILVTFRPSGNVYLEELIVLRRCRKKCSRRLAVRSFE
jgi:hypothetical protein